MSPKPHPNTYDILIAGAGLYGIQAARTYLEIHPQAHLCILESDSVVAGTWSSRRIYDAFWTQTPIGMAEFSDRPMVLPPVEEQYYGFFPAKYVTAYLEAYVDNHSYNERTIRDRITFNVRIENIEKVDDWWCVSCAGGSELRAQKLIDATGMTSEPNNPYLPGRETFQGKILHHKEFGQLGDLKAAQGCHWAVLGGGKSAADVAYAAAKAGKDVSWIIRERGSGPAAFLAAEGRGPYANSNESFYTRFVASFLPNPFGEESFLSKFLHRTRLGSWIVKRVWAAVDEDHRWNVDYQRKEGKDNGFDKLEPDTPIFWQNDSSGVNQREDFYSTIASKVHVYRNDIEEISANSITLAAGSYEEKHARLLPVDVIILCTGWSPVSSLYSPQLAGTMGLPLNLDKVKGPRGFSGETAEAKEFPDPFLSLRNPPNYRKSRPPHTPFCLYKAMVPEVDSNTQSIVFLGKLVVGNNFRAAEVQALWAVAYLDGHLRLEKSSMRQDIIETVSWCRRRYLNKGELGSWFFFDVVDYTDSLLAQLGMKSHRRSWWWRDLFGPCKAAQLEDLIDEYKVLYPQ